MATIASDGSQASVIACIASAAGGDTVTIPVGNFTWGASSSSIALNKAIKLLGAGKGQTIVNLASTSPTSTAGVIAISAAATFGGVTINQPNTGETTAITCSSDADGWRITDIEYPGAANSGYFVYVNCSYGLIDNCHITGGAGNDEWIFVRGKANSWQTPSSMGTDQVVMVEDCTMDLQGYIDANANSRVCVRKCTINGPVKLDSHGKASNTPARSCRHFEAYSNTFNRTGPFNTAIEIRGGTGIFFNNVVSGVSDPSQAWFSLKEYALISATPNFGSVYQTLVNYPIDDQLGVGIDPKSAGSEPLYLINNTGPGGVDWPLNFYHDLTNANALYKTQMGDSNASFVIGDIIKADREFFKHTVGASFNGSTGVGRGTKATMLGITPTKTGVGFWVTDEGSWDSTIAANTSGRLYTWTGSAWVQKYEPFVYPHPLRGALAAPTITVQPQSLDVTEGVGVTFAVGAAANPAPTYQWRKGGVNISGATSSSYTIASTVSGDAGSYDCVVTNSQGTVTTSAATLTVNAAATAPSIVVQPQPVTVTAGNSAIFSVTASGTAPLSYQWRKDGADIAGATSSSYSIGSTATGDAGSYTCYVYNSHGNATTSAAVLTVSAASIPATGGLLLVNGRLAVADGYILRL